MVLVITSKPFPYLLCGQSRGYSHLYRKYEDAIAIGLVNGVSRSAFFISEWKQSEVTQEGKKWEIVPEELPEVLAAELLNKNYSDLLEVCKGYIQRGGFPIIQFPEGGGEIIFLRGRGKDKRQWDAPMNLDKEKNGFPLTEKELQKISRQ